MKLADELEPQNIFRMSSDWDYINCKDQIRDFSSTNFYFEKFDIIKNNVTKEIKKLDESQYLYKKLINIHLVEINYEKEIIYNYRCSERTNMSLDRYLFKYPEMFSLPRNFSLIREKIISTLKTNEDKYYWVSEFGNSIPIYDSNSGSIKTLLIVEFNIKPTAIYDIPQFKFLDKFVDIWQSNWEKENYDEIGRIAASSFIANELNEDRQYGGYNAYKNYEKYGSVIYNITNDLHIISSTYYESAMCNGCMLIGYERDADIWLKNPIPFSNHKGFRKLLEITGEKKGDLILLVDANLGAYGFTIRQTDTMNIDFKLFIKFKGLLKWEVYYPGIGKPLFFFENMLVKVSMKHMGSDMINFSKDLKKIFGNKDVNAKLLYSLVKTATTQKHGTMLVILKEKFAVQEADRLKISSTLMRPNNISKQSFWGLTKIDGAIILDTNGKCHAFGTILDGVVSLEGNSGRGARYNSALRYKNYLISQNIEGLIIVISEDGDVSVISTGRK
ncbi:DNA integrity scanning protein DisA nucleotide-binding domain protein [Bacillus sp. 1P06AnD]|uniref:DNA integrity scanning protein DisA nucleotide-binding domain protein n=1 Tax=Bacillus sp. 1P06AnD TaxID=3132208 RepID=UPI00399F349E